MSIKIKIFSSDSLGDVDLLRAVKSSLTCFPFSEKGIYELELVSYDPNNNPSLVAFSDLDDYFNPQKLSEIKESLEPKTFYLVIRKEGSTSGTYFPIRAYLISQVVCPKLIASDYIYYDALYDDLQSSMSRLCSWTFTGASYSAVEQTIFTIKEL